MLIKGINIVIYRVEVFIVSTPSFDVSGYQTAAPQKVKYCQYDYLRFDDHVHHVISSRPCTWFVLESITKCTYKIYL